MGEYALRLTNGTDTAPRVRIADALGLFPGSDALGARNGLRPGTGGTVTAVVGTMGVQVTPFACWVDGGSSTTQGGYPFVLDAAKTLTLADGHATLSRTDVVAVVVKEHAFDGSGLTEASLTVVQGTPGAGAPSLPASCVPIRNVTVPAGLSAGTGGLSAANLSADRRKWTAALGAILPVASTSDRAELTAHKGMAVYREDTDELQVWNGSAWKSYKPTPTADSTLTPTHASFTGNIRVKEIAPGVVSCLAALDVDTDVSSGFVVTGCVIPVGMRPTADVFASAASYNSTESFRYKFKTDGAVEFQHTGPDSTVEAISVTWFTS